MVFRRMALRVAWAYLALVFLLAPMLGLMHGLTHGPGDSRHAAPAHLVEADESSHAHGWLADLFSAHADESDCRVYDQLCHGDAVPALPLMALPLVLTAFVFLFLQGETLARRAALFEARGPPLTR
ncbi:hypothetical protein [Polaromonas sp.]|uniref:hypothetical protein n=1 Tax=Polaromonas sp. TaxID=1869339 RepID=UPI002731614F|nr:hypothetical protein [Polaromonas sp.]MDP1742748.1 hypothetical protein [Polaromonas sp.]